MTAPDALFAEAEKLAKHIDARSEQYVEVVTPTSGAVFEAVLQEVLLGESSGSRSSSDRNTGSPNVPSRISRPEPKPPVRTGR